MNHEANETRFYCLVQLYKNDFFLASKLKQTLPAELSYNSSAQFQRLQNTESFIKMLTPLPKSK